MEGLNKGSAGRGEVGGGDLLRSRLSVTPRPVFISCFLGKLCILQHGCLACKKRRDTSSECRHKGVGRKRSQGLEGRRGGKSRQRRGFGTQKPQTLRGLVASCSHLRIKHGQRAVGGLSDHGSLEQPTNWRMCLGEDGSSGNERKEAFLSHMPKQCIVHRAKEGNAEQSKCSDTGHVALNSPGNI